MFDGGLYTSKARLVGARSPLGGFLVVVAAMVITVVLLVIVVLFCVFVAVFAATVFDFRLIWKYVTQNHHFCPEIPGFSPIFSFMVNCIYLFGAISDNLTLVKYQANILYIIYKKPMFFSTYDFFVKKQKTGRKTAC